MAGTQPESNPTNMDSTNAQASNQDSHNYLPSPPDSKVHTRKDANLREFLSKMDDFVPLVRACRHSMQLLTQLTIPHRFLIL